MTIHTPNGRFIVCIVIAMLGLGAALAMVLLRSPESARPWRIAITNWPGYDYLYLAQHKGFIRANNLNIELVHINSVTDMRAAFERGLVDGYTSALTDVAESMQLTQTPSRVVLAVDYSHGADLLLAEPSLTTVADLRGRKIGLELSSAVSRYVLGRALEEAGLTWQDIKIIPGSQTVISYQAIRGYIDAIVTYQPYATQIQTERPMHVLYDTTRIPQEIIDAVIVTPEVLEADPEFSRRLQQAWQNAIDYANAHPDETRELFSKRYGTDVPSYMAMTDDVTIIDRAAMHRLARSGVIETSLHATAKVLDPSIPLPAAEVSRTNAIWYQQEGQR